MYALDPEFLANCPYDDEAILIDAILEIDAAQDRVRARMPVHHDLPLTRNQVVSAQHPRHVAAGLMVHATGVVGYIHAHYILGLRAKDGWTGYGVRIHDARFSALAEPDTPLILEGVAQRVRRLNDQIFARYNFHFLQADKTVYKGEQTAVWVRTQSDTPSSNG